MPDVLRISKNLDLDDAAERRVLQSLGQCRSGEMLSVQSLNSTGWRDAIMTLVDKGLAEEVMPGAFTITSRGRRALNRMV